MDLKVQMGMAEQIMTLQLFLLFFPSSRQYTRLTFVCLFISCLLRFMCTPFLAYKFVQYLRGEKGMAHCLLSLWVLLAQKVKMHCSLYYVL